MGILAWSGFVVVGGAPPLAVVLAFFTSIGLPVQLACFPPPPSRLRRVGWTLVATL